MDKQVELQIQAKLNKGVYLVQLTGDITKKSGKQLLDWHHWEAGLPGQSKRLVLDFGRVNYINSAGIGDLIRLVRMGKDGLYQSGCFGLNYHYEKLFHMVGLTRWLTIYPSEWAALDTETEVG
ncbi:STAS domain-containing protein [Ammoniphilus resinae]|uniref:Stage II sporulation protein AA (Anti-sigma F factor antagonist) n=1 Tax=Ammoniphilus resinae TaxID=861532 RepID=A0ABS4GT88_9BACL|nr:STAS domain-containing protein [Ammoniphilus resinae]MBP1933499.1 stage II sporulation protein AA (anti-sigma F factor antagonist) [Ammoniphilus resinae]